MIWKTIFLKVDHCRPVLLTDGSSALGNGSTGSAAILSIFLLLIILPGFGRLFSFSGFKVPVKLLRNTRMSSITSLSKSATTADVIDKSKFNKSIPLISLKIPAKLCNVYLATCKDICFNRPKVRRIYTIENDPDHRLLLLAEDIKGEEDFPVELKELNSTHGAVSEPFSFQITYDQLGVDECLKQLLPAEIAEIPCSFEQAGHLAHVNLREECLPYKHIIGQVILDKNPAIKTVVNKVGNIETEFRTFPMEVWTLSSYNLCFMCLAFGW